MEQQRQRRSRKTQTPTTGTLVHTAQDARGFCDPLSRYGELPANILCGLYNTLNNLPAKSGYPKHRLKDLFQESLDFPPSRLILTRPGYQWRHGINHQTLYRKAPGTNRLLHHCGIYDESMLRWANTTQIVQLNGEMPPSDHDASLSIAAASIELSARRSGNVGYITHIKILKHASPEAQNAASPLSIPVKEIAHSLPSGERIYLKDFHVKPDNVFGLSYAEEPKFFALEHDRSTEDIEPTKSLTRASWLRKILAYSAISAHDRTHPPTYETYFKIPSLLVLGLFQDERRMGHAMALAAKHARYPDQFLFATIPPIDPLLDASPIPKLFEEEWHRVSGKFSLKEGR